MKLIKMEQNIEIREKERKIDKREKEKIRECFIAMFFGVSNHVQ